MNDEQKRLAKRMKTAFSNVLHLSMDYAIAQEEYDAAAREFNASMEKEVSLPADVAMDAMAAMIRNAGK